MLAGLLLAGLVALVVWLLLVQDGEPEAVPVAPSGEVSVSAAVLDFGDQQAGHRSPTQPVTLSNGTGEAIRVEDVTVEGPNADEFGVVEDGCLSTRLEESEACTVTVRFRPEGQGERSAQLVFSLDREPGIRAVELTGAGVGSPAPIVVPARLDFGPVELATRSAPQTVTIVNAGALPLELRRASIEGDAAADYRLARRGGCPALETLEPGAACSITVTFAPAEADARPATLVVAYAGGAPPSRIALRGSGAGAARPQVSPTVLRLGRVEVGSSSAAGAVTLRNDGTAPLAVRWIAVAAGDSGDFVLSGGGCAAGSELAPGASCTASVRFAPTEPGPREASLVIATDAAAPFLEVVVRGTGREPPATPVPESAETPPAATGAFPGQTDASTAG